MSEYVWMADTLRLMTIDELRDLGVTVYQAPKVPKRARVINLTNGLVVDFSAEGEMPSEGSYARYEEVIALAEKYGLKLVEQNGTLEPVMEEAAEPAEA
ncbi:MAG TPA: hypothetical protein VG815_07190 [Chloroflexota bacterium]|jgi:hypothetical protein|nr:hypothetical protein [Chloroflexota bacterium]